MKVFQEIVGAFEEDTIPSTHAMIKSARKNDRLVNMEKARSIDRSFCKGYYATSGTHSQVATYAQMKNYDDYVVTKRKRIGKDAPVQGDAAFSGYNNLLQGLPEEYSPYKNTILYSLSDRPQITSYGTFVNDIHNGRQATQPGLIRPNEFYGAPFQIQDGLDKFGKFPTFDKKKWDEEDTEGKILDVIDSDSDGTLKKRRLNGMDMYVPDGIENILGAFGQVWTEDNDRKYNLSNNIYLGLYPQKTYKNIQDSGKKTGINDMKEELTAQYNLLNLFNNAKHGNADERTSAKFIEKFAPALTGRVYAYSPLYAMSYDPGRQSVFIGSPDLSLNLPQGRSGSGDYEEIIHAEEDIANPYGNSKLSDMTPGAFDSMDMSDKLYQDGEDTDTIRTGNAMWDRVRTSNGKVKARDIREISELLSNIYLLQKVHEISFDPSMKHWDRDYGRSWLKTDVAHPPRYYIKTDSTGNPILQQTNGNPRATLKASNLNAEIFNSVLNPFITGNRSAQEWIKKYVPNTYKSAFDRIRSAIDLIKDEDVGTKYSITNPVHKSGAIIQ